MKRFYKDQDGKWYFDMPNAAEIGVPKEALEMILGADNMLNDLSKGNTEISINIFSSHEILPLTDRNYVYLFKYEESSVSSGCYYIIPPNKHTNISLIWLCSVTEIIFGCFPEYIYIQIN